MNFKEETLLSFTLDVKGRQDFIFYIENILFTLMEDTFEIKDYLVNKFKTKIKFSIFFDFLPLLLTKNDDDIYIIKLGNKHGIFSKLYRKYSISSWLELYGINLISTHQYKKLEYLHKIGFGPNIEGHMSYSTLES